jgi:serine/threonine protein kinase
LDGRFQIEEVLGSGGMSVVYKATQLRVNRHVAIKTLRLQLDTKEIYRERFQREIASLCALSHPNIVTVYDAIIGPDDQPYVVMDYLRGRSLEALIEDEGPMSVERFARIAIQICSALEHAHKKGIIHRDLKPGNVVLMDDEMDFVKVVDFGLAKIGDQNRRLTHSGELWGSPPYMSPEQCMGEAQDQRSDLYSIGAVMYEMLTGFDPYRSATTVFEFIKFHTSVPPPAMHTTNALVRVPQKVEAVVFKALEKDPAKRYQSAKELQKAIVEACSSAVDSKSGEMLFHMANQASSQSSSKVSASQANVAPEDELTQSQAFKRALNPFNSEMFREDASASNEALNSAPGAMAQAEAQPDSYAESQAESFTPSVQRWRPQGAPGALSNEVVKPPGEIVKPAGEVVAPPAKPTIVEAQSASASSLEAPAPAGLSAQPAAYSGLSRDRKGPPSNKPQAPSRLSRPEVAAEGMRGTNSVILVFLLVLAVIAGAIYFVPGLTGHGGSQAKTTTPAAAEHGDVPADSPIGTKQQAASEQSPPTPAETDKSSKTEAAVQTDESAAAKVHQRNKHTGARGQAGVRSAHQAVSPVSAGQASTRSAPATTRSSSAAASHASSPASHSGPKSDPWSALENLRKDAK